MAVTLTERSKVEVGLAVSATVLLLGAQSVVLSQLANKPSREDMEKIAQAAADTYVRKDVLDARLDSLEREIGSLNMQVSSSRVEFAEIKSKLK